MEEVSGRKVPLVQAGRREGDVGICVAEPTKAENELGWKTQKTLMHSCRDLCRFLNIPVTESVATEHDDGMDCGVKAP
jgi:UDP-glucose 4-epimerase